MFVPLLFGYATFFCKLSDSVIETWINLSLLLDGTASGYGMLKLWQYPVPYGTLGVCVPFL
jgi:hypothetical protein